VIIFSLLGALLILIVVTVVGAIVPANRSGPQS